LFCDGLSVQTDAGSESFRPDCYENWKAYMARPKSHDIAPDSPQYVEIWARDLVAAVGKREARTILADYKAIAEDPKVTKHGRNAAAERAEALERLL
jgi:hypothetical protein